MIEPHLYSFQQYALSSDPRFSRVGDELSTDWQNAKQRITLDGEPMDGRVRWCVTGDPGMISLWVKPDGHFVTDETTGRAKHELRRGRVEVIPVEPERTA